MPGPLLNIARLPRYRIANLSRTTPVPTNAQLTRLVSTDRDRHSYLLPMQDPDKETKELLAAIRKKAVRSRLDALSCHIARQVDGLPLGYLLRVNAIEDSEGNIVPRPGGMFGEVGFGTYPLDALATAVDRPVIAAPAPPLKDGSYYVWYTCIAGELEATVYETDLSQGMDTRAREEAQRRRILGQALRSAGGAAQAQVAEYWRDVAIRREQVWGNAATARRMAALQAQLDAAQRQFNAAHENYVSVSRELANQAAETQTLNFIGAVLSAGSAGVQLYEQAKAWRQTKADNLRAERAEARQKAEGAQAGLQAAQAATQQEWATRGYPPVPAAKVPTVTDPFEHHGEGAVFDPYNEAPEVNPSIPPVFHEWSVKE